MSTNSSVVGVVFSGLKSAESGVEPLVRHRHHADVRLDGAERVVGRRRLGRAERALKRVDLPTLGSPTMPMESAMLPSGLADESRAPADRGWPAGANFV